MHANPCKALVQIIGMVAIQNFFCFNRERKVNQMNQVGKWLQDLACRTNENEENKRAHRYFKIYERNRIHPMGNRRQQCIKESKMEFDIYDISLISQHFHNTIATVSFHCSDVETVHTSSIAVLTREVELISQFQFVFPSCFELAKWPLAAPCSLQRQIGTEIFTLFLSSVE